jgi:DNA-3-methyladenine glycosylase II
LGKGAVAASGSGRQPAAGQRADPRAQRNDADGVVNGRVDLGQLHRRSDAEARETQTAIVGIGPWTADIYLIMALRRPDVWPVADLALAKSVMRLKRLRRVPGEARLQRIANAWRPWRSVAARMAWHYYLCGYG